MTRNEKTKAGREEFLTTRIIRGANDRTRTGDLRITSALLYQLSHVGNSFGFPKHT